MEIAFPADENYGARGYGDVRGQPAKKWGTDAVLETENSTPYFLNLHNGEVAHTLILGMTGSGKTPVLSGIREGAEQNGYAVEGFAPTSRAAGQLRDAGIPADTLQEFLARGGTERSAGDPNGRHLYMLDESSLASTRQMQAFLEKIGPQDRVLLIGDTRQHQGVDAGKPFEQMQEAGMRTSQLDQIIRQKDPELLRAVEHLSRNETNAGIQLLQEQGVSTRSQTANSASRPSRRNTLRDPRARLSYRPITRAAGISMMPSESNCNAPEFYQRRITR